MKTSVSVQALKSFEHNGRSYTPGQSVDLSVVDAVALSKRHFVTLTKRKVVPVPEPTPTPPVHEPVIETPKRGRYKRRDLQAEDTTALQADQGASEMSEVTADTPPVDE